MRRRLHDLLTASAERAPESCAVVFQGQQTSYAEMEAASTRLARTLRSCGCQRGDRVALLLPKSTRALIAMFGTLKADCIYVPMDTGSPAARLVRILRSCESKFVLAVQSTRALLAEIAKEDGLGGARVGWLDDGCEWGGESAFSWGDVSQQPASPVDTLNTEADPVHILFTSGSTGQPKGVVITHSNVLHFLDWAIPYFGMDSSDRISGHPPLHFDLSTFDVYGTVAAGAQIHLVQKELSVLPHRLADFIRDAQLTQWFSVPSILHHMAKFDAVRSNDFPALKRVLWCGEKFPTPALRHWMSRLPKVQFFNLYGPTEATIASSYYHVPCCPGSDTAEIPIGDACGGERLLVLNDELAPVERGATGDLYIGGVGLSPGYWRDPEKTRQSFVQDPANPGEQIYKTGDLARRGEDGAIYLIGRADSQIKSRGYRIELGEIEAALQAVPGLQEAAVVAVDGSGFEGTEICCAYVTSRGHELSPMALKKDLARVLPPYMIPAHWLALENMPRNGNGKTDRPRLREQFRHQSEGAANVA